MLAHSVAFATRNGVGEDSANPMPIPPPSHSQARCCWHSRSSFPPEIAFNAPDKALTPMVDFD